MVGDLFHVLYGCGHKRLLAYISQPPQTAIAKPVELFSVREASLNSFFSFAVQEFAGFA
jgi:hypothetical protein